VLALGTIIRTLDDLPGPVVRERVLRAALALYAPTGAP
jgi:hypothetical protein